MTKMKFYAVKCPEFQKIVRSWEECENLVKGRKGVRYKSFSTLGEAESFLTGQSVLKPGLRVFVDGSWSPSCPYSGWAFVAVENEQELARAAGITKFPAESRNIDGEVMAAYQAMLWLHKENKAGIICHDYQGIAEWALGRWQAKSSIARRYKTAIAPYVSRVSFEKVTAHSGNRWNELVDSLAKEAVSKALKASDTLSETR